MKKLVSITPPGGSAFKVLFNPNTYSVAKANHIAEAAVPGLNAPILQFVNGNARTLEMDLFFDSYEEGTDVSKETDKIYKLLMIDPDTHAPPICEIAWGSFTLTAVLDHVSGKCTSMSTS